MTALLSNQVRYLSARLEQGTLCRPYRGSGALSFFPRGQGQGHGHHSHSNSHIQDLLHPFVQECFQGAYCVPHIVLIRPATRFYLTGGRPEVQRGERLVSSPIHSAIRWQSQDSSSGQVEFFSVRMTLQTCLHKKGIFHRVTEPCPAFLESNLCAGNRVLGVCWL